MGRGLGKLLIYLTYDRYPTAARKQFNHPQLSLNYHYIKMGSHFSWRGEEVTLRMTTQPVSAAVGTIAFAIPHFSKHTHNEILVFWHPILRSVLFIMTASPGYFLNACQIILQPLTIACSFWTIFWGRNWRRREIERPILSRIHSKRFERHAYTRKLTWGNPARTPSLCYSFSGVAIN